MSGEALHFNCTQCGAGLDALGGGRVRTHVCPYCGSELDAQDDYKVIKQHRDLQRPDTPFSIGDTGEFWGVEFTIIGTIAWNEYYQGQSWVWVDHQIYSPTHGYAWLTVENGYVTYARKTRDTPRPAAISQTTINTAEVRPSISFQEESYSYYGSGTASPTFIEGEFNYQPDMEESIHYVSLVGGERMLDIVTARDEREYEISHLPDQKALYDSFGIPAAARPRTRGVHPLDAFDRSPTMLFVRNLCLAAAVAAILIGTGLYFKGTQIARSEVVSAGSEITLPFSVTSGIGLTEITVWADADNSWAWFEAELTDASDEPVAAFERGVEYYHGSDWTEGSRASSTRLKLEPGDYTLYAQMIETGTWGGGNQARQIMAFVRQGTASTYWLWMTAFLFGLAGAALLAQRLLHNMRRWSGSDWSDED